MWLRENLLCSRIQDPLKRKQALELKLARSQTRYRLAQVATVFASFLFFKEIIFQKNFRPVVLIFFALVVTYLYKRVIKLQKQTLEDVKQKTLTSFGYE